MEFDCFRRVVTTIYTTLCRLPCLVKIKEYATVLAEPVQNSPAQWQSFDSREQCPARFGSQNEPGNFLRAQFCLLRSFSVSHGVFLPDRNSTTLESFAD